MNPKISVIVPIYNVEEYIEKCINSLVNQNYPNLDIILIDDCSLDNSKNIAIKFSKKYKNIKFLSNKENRGLSYTRNIGIENATGEYISFIDSDDFVSENYFSSLVNTIIKQDADVVVCDINTITDNGEIRKKCGDINNSLEQFINTGLAASACNKLFKKEVFNKYRFEEGKINEDLAVILPILINSKKVVYNSEVFYNYYQRENSIQNKKLSFKRFDIFDAVELTLKRINKKSKYADMIIFNQLILFLLYVIPKEKKFFYRYKLLRRFYKLSKGYNYIDNRYFKEFITESGKIGGLFYNYLVFFTKKGFCLIANLMISFYHIYTKIKNRNIVKNNIEKNDLIEKAEKQKKMLEPSIKVSVIIPNYNYSLYLYQRIYSILSQNYKIYELIILDDASTDNSRVLIDEIVDILKPYMNIKKIYNKKNSGRAFIQWQKGFDEAKGDYVWIAEADDYCNKKFLKTVINPIKKNKEVVISYCDTKFVNSNGNIMLNTISKEIDIQKSKHFDKNYIIDGKEEFNKYTYLNCTIANVSGAIIKKMDYSKEFALAINYKQAGDWIFYASIMQNGYIAYNKNSLNYYRVHDKNVSTITKKNDHLNEIKSIHSYYRNKYGFNKKQENNIKLRYDFLKKTWNLDKE